MGILDTRRSEVSGQAWEWKKVQAVVVFRFSRTKGKRCAKVRLIPILELVLFLFSTIRVPRGSLATLWA